MSEPQYPLGSGQTTTGPTTSTPTPDGQLERSEREMIKTISQFLDLKTEMGSERIKVALKAIKLFDKKQHDYGSRNIHFSDSPEMNTLGVTIRLNDKIQRMLNLGLKGLKGGDRQVKDESLWDTATDVCNYGAILMILLSDRWK